MGCLPQVFEAVQPPEPSRDARLLEPLTERGQRVWYCRNALNAFV